MKRQNTVKKKQPKPQVTFQDIIDEEVPHGEQSSRSKKSIDELSIKRHVTAGVYRKSIRFNANEASNFESYNDYLEAQDQKSKAELI